MSRPEKRETERGLIVQGAETVVGEIRAILAAARPEEKERWRQLEHPITHKIIMQWRTDLDVRPGDVFTYRHRRFYNQTFPYDVGDIGHWTIFYCDERADV